MIKCRLMAILATFSLLITSCDFFFTNDAPEDPDNQEHPGNQEQPGNQDQPQYEEEPTSYDWTGETVTFQESSAVLANPERGFYKAQDFDSDTSPLKASAVKAQRAEGRTLWYTGYYLTDFMTGSGDISKAYLDKIQATMDALREGGAKCVLRFAYKRSDSSGAKPWDPSEEIVLHHIDQIKPILQKNEDVIFVLQAGFVGVWGEWYYTSNFIFDPQTNADYQPRKHVCDALLAALPKSRQIQLRTPQFKMRLFGLSAKDTITRATAHNGSDLSRIGGHNDCFGAAYDDWGTFDNETGDRKFWKADTRYTIMGGETCNVSDYCVCDASLKDMKDYHWTYLNSGYNGDVLSRWRSSGCMDDIVARLGYRLVLEKVERGANPVAGEDLDIAIRFRNDGFAAPMNPRNAELVFIDASGKKTFFTLPYDPRTWHPGPHLLVTKIKLPSEKGSLYLNLSDPLLPDNPLYSIALANEGVFDKSTGYNKLFEL
ncbi:MAG: DUF4832 domain-containing protein [Bacteroidales bacterium]|nr:DUF4832 domain-containing protein [Bacteroidales bacterium]